MTCKHGILAAALLIAAPCWLLAEEYQPATAGAPTSAENSVVPALSPYEAAAGTDSGYESPWLARGQYTYRRDIAFRFGWWFLDTDGSPSGIGEWQGLRDNTPFWDVDGISSDGRRTLDFTITGPEDETTHARGYYYTPHLTTDVEFGRFIHRTGFKPLDAWFNTPNTSTLYGDNLTTTTDNAIRVQELDVKFKGHLTENIKWGLDVWGMRKFGERQKMSMDHGCTRTAAQGGRGCHQVTVTQNIDWVTMQLEPYVEARFGCVTAEYRRTMRGFQQSDDLVSRSYGGGDGHPNEVIDPFLQYPFGAVSENYTEIDRLKIGADLTQNTRLYSVLFTGNTHNKNRETDRGFWGADFRVTNRTFDNLKITGFVKRYEESNQAPPTFPEDHLYLDEAKPSEEYFFDSGNRKRPVDRQKTFAGFDARWTPFRCNGRLNGLALTTGYKYSEIERQYVTYEIIGAEDASNTSFTQPDTVTHLIHVGADMRWSPCFDTYARFKTAYTDFPLFGVREADEATMDPDLENPSDITALNTNQPKHVDRFEFGGTWTPTYNFLVSAMVGLETRQHRSSGANFDEDDYPITLTAWYAPTCRWSISGGAGFYSNWIDQDITFGNQHASSRGDEPQDTQLVGYGGRATVFNLGTDYDLTERLRLTGAIEFVRGRNTWFVPSPAGVDWSTLPEFSNVVVETTRFSTGFDYALRSGVTTYLRYIYYDYNDETAVYKSGTAHMVLGGLTAVY